MNGCAALAENMLASAGDRVILHADLNNFFASVECMKDASLSRLPVAVCGSAEQRHGIVLAKNQIAKSFGVKTGETIGEARVKCPSLKILEPHYEEYVNYSNRTRDIYKRYTDRIEAFGIDECWLDVTGSTSLFGDGSAIADDLRETVKKELSLTVSVGVSFNKVFAKLGSDMKKPDGTTCIPKASFKDVIWRLPASDLLGIGRATRKKLWFYGIRTIGDIASAPPEYMTTWFGKCGWYMWVAANGLDTSPVLHMDYSPKIKSIGHGNTGKKDIEDNIEADNTISLLSADVGKRLRAAGLCARGVSVAVRDSSLAVCEYQGRLPRPTQSSLVIANTAYDIFRANYGWEKPVRSLTVRAINLIDDRAPRQMDIFELEGEENKSIRLYEAVDSIRERFGDAAILPASAINGKELFGNLPPKTLPGSYRKAE